MVSDHPTGSTSSLRRTHRGLALRHLLVEGGASRTQIADRLGLSQMAATRIARDLMEAGLIEEAGTAHRECGPGRHQTLLRINAHSTYAAGIVLSAYPTEVMIVDALGTPIRSRRVSIEKVSDGSAGIEKLARSINALIAELALPRGRVAGVGIAVAANLDQSRRQVIGSGFLGWSPFDLVGPVEDITGLPVRAENIANSLALAETSVGVAKNMTNVAVIRASAQIGASIIQGGHIVRGESLKAGRVGHLKHKKTSLECFCGNHDCLNCSASGWSVLFSLGLAHERRYTPERVGEYATALEDICNNAATCPKEQARRVRALRASGGALANGLHALCLILEPEAIVVDGPLSRASEYMEGIRIQLIRMGESGREALSKLKRGEIRAVQAAAILALMDHVYSSKLDFEAFCASAAPAPVASTRVVTP